MSKSEKGKAALTRARLTGLIKAKDKDFDPHRKIVKAVLGEDYK